MDFLKNNWFVCVIAIAIIGFVAYFVYDQNKDNVTVKKADGQDVIATLTGANITAEDLYEKGEPFDSSLLYYAYKNAVIDQSVKTTDELKETAENMQSIIVTNAKYQSDDYEALLTTELAGYGYTSFDDLYNYCLTSAKENVLDQEYIAAHYDELKSSVEELKPREISIITMEVADPDELTDEEKQKQENIDAMIEEDSFAKAATTFSDDTDSTSSANGGSYGYVDSSTTSLDSSVLSAVLEVEKGNTTDWIAVQDSTTGTYKLYKAYVDEDSLDEIYNNADDSLMTTLTSTFISANPTLQAKAIEEAASRLDITFEDENVKKKIEEQIASAIGSDEETEESSSDDEDTAEEPEESTEEGEAEE